MADNAALPQFHAPGPPIDAAKLKGKTVFVLPASSTIPFTVAIAQGIADAGKRLGIDVTVYPNQGQPSQWVQGMDQAISDHVAAITLVAADPKLIGPQIAAAKRAGIPVVSMASYDIADSSLPHPLRAPNLAGIVDSPFSLAAKLETDQAIVSTNCKANIVAIESAEYPNFTYMAAAAKAEVARNCPACHLTMLNVPVVDWASKLQPNLQTTLISDPAINWVEPLVDPMTQYAVPAVVASGRTGKVRMSTFNGTPFALKFVRDGKIVTMDIAENLYWKGWAALDQTMRVMLGDPAIQNYTTPVRVFNTANVGQAGNPPSYNTGLGSSYIPGYLKLWGASS